MESRDGNERGGASIHFSAAATFPEVDVVPYRNDRRYAIASLSTRCLFKGAHSRRALPTRSQTLRRILSPNITYGQYKRRRVYRCIILTKRDDLSPSIRASVLQFCSSRCNNFAEKTRGTRTNDIIINYPVQIFFLPILLPRIYLRRINHSKFLSLTKTEGRFYEKLYRRRFRANQPEVNNCEIKNAQYKVISAN